VITELKLAVRQEWPWLVAASWIIVCLMLAAGCTGDPGPMGPSGLDGVCECPENPAPCPTPSPEPTPTPPPPPPVCEVTERPGDECAWNEVTCAWECIPPPVPDFGICHVSNKGEPGSLNNLQVSYKENGEGHEKHLDCASFYPPDFRSNRAACTVENAKLAAEACS
jgi:hypothetical protein